MDVRQFLQQRVGLDGAILFTIAARAVQFASGFLTLLLIVRFLTPEEQGFYYTFNSILGMQILLELGFGGVLMQFISHEWAHLSFAADQTITGDPYHRDRFVSLVRLGVRWFLVIAVVFLLLCSGAGWWFFSLRPHTGVEWEGPWVGVVFAFSLFIFFSPFLSILEGCQKISDAAFIRFAGVLANMTLGWAALGVGLKLYFPMFAFLGNVLVHLLFLAWKYPFLLRIPWSPAGDTGRRVSWKDEIWPMQSRIAVSFGLGFVLFNLYSPVLFHFHGPVEAGRTGMTLAIINGIAAIGMAWVGTKAPRFGKLIAQGRTAELKALFRQSLQQSYAAVIGAGAGGFLTIQLLGSAFPRFAQRLLPPAGFLLLLAWALVNHLVSCQAVFLRAFKEEPFLFPTIVGSLFVGIADFALGIPYGGMGIAAGYLAGAVLLLPLPFSIWWRRWQALG